MSNLVGVAPLDGVARKGVEGTEQQLPGHHLHLGLCRASVLGVTISAISQEKSISRAALRFAEKGVIYGWGWGSLDDTGWLGNDHLW